MHMRPTLDTSHRTPRTRTRRHPSPHPSHARAPRAVVFFPPRLREYVSAASLPRPHPLLRCPCPRHPYLSRPHRRNHRHCFHHARRQSHPPQHPLRSPNDRPGEDSITGLVYIGLVKRWRLTNPSPLPSQHPLPTCIPNPSLLAPTPIFDVHRERECE
ncbi:hypothetical protein K438DRAFT_1003657 [Mycena galopus ATCC 62051]|nr:hypothetical protein K438DRAFT_1003657 [Mycena galopus ATCC 62051]